MAEWLAPLTGAIRVSDVLLIPNLHVVLLLNPVRWKGFGFAAVFFSASPDSADAFAELAVVRKLVGAFGDNRQTQT